MYKVLKKNGLTEDFDWNKLTQGIMKAGASAEDAEKVAMKVEEWLNSVAEDGVIKSYDLHVKVLEVLKEVNAKVGQAFEDFRKPDASKE